MPPYWVEHPKSSETERDVTMAADIHEQLTKYITDAHSIRGLGNMRLAVHTARRGWAGKSPSRVRSSAY